MSNTTFGRQSPNPAKRDAHQVLDRVRAGEHVDAAEVDRALANLGEPVRRRPVEVRISRSPLIRLI